MGDQARHLEQARANRDHAEFLVAQRPSDPTAMQWAVTAAFYCAVHCIEAHLATFGVDSRSHADRGYHMSVLAYGIPDVVADAYAALKRRSMGARYLMWNFTERDVRRKVLDRQLKAVTDFVNL